MENFIWVQENYGTMRVLVFDRWSDGLVEAWIVPLVDEDIEYILDELREGKRKHISDDLLADYNSDHYDYGTVEYDDLWAETQEGLWIPEDEWLENNL